MDKGKPLMDWQFDTRVISRNISEGALTNNDYKSFLEKLPDVAAKGEPVRTALPGQGVDDEGDLDEQD